METAVADYAISVGSTPKYKKNFTHFDYVNPNAPKQGTINISEVGYFDSLFPYGIKSNYATSVSSLVYDTLLMKSWDEPLVAYPLIADSVILGKDNLSVTFTINPEARFADNSPITAADVVASYNLLLSPSSHPRYKNYFADIKSVKIVSHNIVTFLFFKKNNELPMIIATDLPILSKKWIDSHKNTYASAVPLSSGPYTIESYKIGKTIKYKLNDSYWAQSLPTRVGMYNFSQIVVKYFRDPTVAITALVAGNIDWLREFNSKNWATKYRGLKYTTGRLIKKTFRHENNAGIQGFVFNLRVKKFQDIRVRKAISLAFDFAWSNHHLFYNQYTRCTSYFSNSLFSASQEPSVAEYTQLSDITSKLPLAEQKMLGKELNQSVGLLQLSQSKRMKLAAELLKSAGVSTMEINFPLAQKGFERILHRFSYSLSLLGITLNYKTFDYALYQERVNRYDYDMRVISYPSGEKPGNELKNFFHSSTADIENQYNFSGVKNSTVDSLIAKLLAAKNLSELKISAANLDRVLMSLWLMVPNWYINYHRLSYIAELKYHPILPKYYSDRVWSLSTWWIEDDEND